MKATGNTRAGTGLVAIIGLYVIAYFLSTDLFLGRLDATRYRIRLFRSETHRQVFQPLTFLENLVSPRDREFFAEIRNHASLPPPE